MPSFFQNQRIVKVIEVMASVQEEKIYRLPVDPGCTDCYVKHNESLPTFAEFEYPIYKFKV
jgi:hypothetical protein